MGFRCSTCENNGTVIFYSSRVTAVLVADYSNKTDTAHYKIICIINDIFFTRGRGATGSGGGNKEKTNSYRVFSVRNAFRNAYVHTRRRRRKSFVGNVMKLNRA